ncbi:MAG: aldehyde dehydrogenase family protein [Tepidisphaera sp.]
MIRDVLRDLGLANDPRLILDAKGPAGVSPDGSFVVSENPATGQPLAGVRLDDAHACDRIVAESVDAFKAWREVPAPVRGQVVRVIADEFRRLKEPLGKLVSLEVGKILQEGLGEVQETIDIADFAVGLSRQLPGSMFPSERPQHKMYEQWLPLGPIGVITAFNFPNAVWGWNAMLGAICGDSTIWKPSLMAPLTAVATNAIAERIATSMGHPGIFKLVIGTDDQVGERLVRDRRIPLISATGSCRMGRAVGAVVAERLGRCLLELGGNNAIIVDPTADLEVAIPSIVFGAVGTAGQRCTTTRRLILHKSIAEKVVERLVRAYKTITLGDPLSPSTLVGPLINQRSVDGFHHAVRLAQQQGGKVLAGGNALDRGPAGGYFVQPTIIQAPPDNRLPISDEETFAPILYVFTYETLDEAIAMNNGVQQGLSSAIFTDSVRAAERFLSPSGSGSDCGIANVNLGTSGAEIGGAFGGEKETGGGRESGSDCWKIYMRRQTTTINAGASVRLAQGIQFG